MWVSKPGLWRQTAWIPISSLLLSILVITCTSFLTYEMGIKMVPNSQGYCED